MGKKKFCAFCSFKLQDEESIWFEHARKLHDGALGISIIQYAPHTDYAVKCLIRRIYLLDRTHQIFFMVANIVFNDVQMHKVPW